jgi:hypothetical protein
VTKSPGASVKPTTRSPDVTDDPPQPDVPDVPEPSPLEPVLQPVKKIGPIKKEITHKATKKVRNSGFQSDCCLNVSVRLSI